MEVQSAYTQVNKTVVNTLPLTELNTERDVGNQSAYMNQDEGTNSMRMSLGLGQLLESAKSFKNTHVNNFNPMFESIKKSFQSILGSS